MADNLVAIKVGRGIGAGVVIGGELFHGDGSSAGEIGHTVVVDDGAACRCGRFGCLETVASSRAIVRRALEAAGEAPGSWLGRRLAEHGDLELDDVVAAVQAGDESARLIAVSAGRYLGGTVAALASALDIERIVLLGTVTRLGEPWLAAVREEAMRRSLPSIGARTRIELTTSRGNETVQGAAALLLTGPARPEHRPMSGTESLVGVDVGGTKTAATIVDLEMANRTGSGSLVAGVDVGGTTTSIVVTDDRDRVLYEHVAPTDPSSLVGQIAGLVDDARRQLGRDLVAVGVAVPGHVDPADGSVSMAVNLGITHLALGPMLQTELGDTRSSSSTTPARRCSG